MKYSSTLRILVFFFTVMACSTNNQTEQLNDAGTKSDAGDSGTGDAGNPAPDTICLETGKGPFSLSFTDVTVEMGLGPDGLNIAGTNVTIADVNGDGWPDIALTKGKSERETPESPKGIYRLLVNEKGGAFHDATFEAGLFTARDNTPGRASSFLVFADIDNDGDQDAFSAVIEDADKTVEDYSSVFFNDGNGNFTIGPEQRFTNDLWDPAVSAAFLDYDKDGLIDLFVGHHYGRYGYYSSTIQDSLFAGDGKGAFSDVTEIAGLTTLPFSLESAAAGQSHKPTWGVTACDVDGDGWTDLMTTSYGRTFNGMYRNNGGVFQDLTLTSGFGSDENQDYGDDNFYLCFCQAHPDAAECLDAQSPIIVCDGLENAWSSGSDDQPWRLGGNSSNTVCGDIDNDGDMDLLAVELAHWHIGGASDKTELLINDDFPNNPFVRPGNTTTGLVRNHGTVSWNEGDLSGALSDLDNDGRMDVLIASSDYPYTYSLIWQQQADGTFLEVGESSGTRYQRSHGLGLIDFDRDGDMDLVVTTSVMRWGANDNPPAPDDTYAYLLRNDNGQDSNKMMFNLTGKGKGGGANKSAIGARIIVEAGGTTYVREVNGGYGLTGSQHDPLVHIGIGENCIADSVTIKWPNATADEVVFKNVPANYVLNIEEGVGISYKLLEDF